MTATCQLCGHTVRVDTAPMLLNPGTDPAAAAAVAEISTFDLLAGRMSQHLQEHEAQSLEMAAVMHLAAKVYAMTWAENPDEEFQALREAWRSGILQMMQATTNPVAVYDAGAVAPGSSEGSAPPLGSNVKKSVRNASN